MSLSDLFFPSLCLHCESKLSQGEKILCLSCFEGLRFEKKPFRLVPFSFVCPLWEMEGASQRLVQAFQGGQKYLARGLASFLLYRFYELDLGEPELITFVPTEPHQKWSLGFCPRKILAQELSQLWGVTFDSLLDWQGEELKLRKRTHAKKVLLVDLFCDNEILLKEAGYEIEESGIKSLSVGVLASRLEEPASDC